MNLPSKSQILLRQQVGQLLIMGFDGAEATPANPALQTLLADIQPGGVILFARNIVSPVQCFDLLAQCREQVNSPLFTCVDLEGGTVDRFRQIFAPTPSENEVSATGARKLFRRQGEVLGNEARALGFNVDFAPVSDLGFEASRSVLGSRTVSADVQETIVYVREFLRGLKSAGVLGCGKHFPGLGEANLDSHHSLPEIQKPWKSLWKEDLLPYRELRKQFPFIMVAHVAYPGITGDHLPASLSKKWLTEILRKKIGYRGIILSDDLDMGGVLAAGSVEHAAIETLRAGADMFLVCQKQENARAAFEAVLREAERDQRFARQIASSAARVLAFKLRAPELKHVAARPTEKKVAALGKQLDAFKKQLAKASHQR